MTVLPTSLVQFEKQSCIMQHLTGKTLFNIGKSFCILLMDALTFQESFINGRSAGPQNLNSQ